MDIKIVDDEPYQIINIGLIETKDANNSLESAYIHFIQSSHQLLRYCLYAKHKKIDGYKRFTNKSLESEIINDLYNVLSEIYSVANHLYSSSSSVTKYDCFEMVDSLKSDKLSKIFKMDKEFERMMQATLELYLAYIAFVDKNYTWSFAYKAIFDESNSLLRVYLKNASDGSIGGTKGKTDEQLLLSIYQYHDEYLADKKENGKFKLSSPKAVKEICEHFVNIPYEVPTLVNYIKAHRRKTLSS